MCWHREFLSCMLIFSKLLYSSDHFSKWLYSHSFHSWCFPLHFLEYKKCKGQFHTDQAHNTNPVLACSKSTHNKSRMCLFLLNPMRAPRHFALHCSKKSCELGQCNVQSLKMLFLSFNLRYIGWDLHCIKFHKVTMGSQCHSHTILASMKQYLELQLKVHWTLEHTHLQFFSVISQWTYHVA